jgi:hypothetical protein
MKGFFVHDGTGKVKSFGIAGETEEFKVRVSMKSSHGSVAAVEIDPKHVEEIRSTRSQASPKLSIGGTAKEPTLTRK